MRHVPTEGDELWLESPSVSDLSRSAPLAAGPILQSSHCAVQSDIKPQPFPFVHRRHVHDYQLAFSTRWEVERNTQSSHFHPHFQTIRQLVNGQKVNSKIL